MEQKNLLFRQDTPGILMSTNAIQKLVLKRHCVLYIMYRISNGSLLCSCMKLVMTN